MILLKFIFLIFIAFFVILFFIAFKFYKVITRTQRRFRHENTEEGININGNTIVDHRPKSKRDRKIIGDDEGEYVDFVDSNKDAENICFPKYFTFFKQRKLITLFYSY